MKVALMESECYYDINLRFRIDNLQQIFEHCSLSPIASSTPLEIYTTEPFGPGSSWHIKCEHSNVGGEDYLSCVLVVGPKGYPAPITWSFTGTSSQGGVQYFRRSSTHLFTSEDKVGWGWTDTVATRTWEGFDILRRENALYVSATIRARVAPAVCPDRCLDLSYDVVTTERPGDLEFITSCGRKHAGGEPRQRRLFASSDVLREVCPQLVERVNNCAPSATGARQLLVQPRDGERPHQALRGDYNEDSDSDYEDEDEEDEATSPSLAPIHTAVTTPDDATATNISTQTETQRVTHGLPIADTKHTTPSPVNQQEHEHDSVADIESWDDEWSPLELEDKSEWVFEDLARQDSTNVGGSALMAPMPCNVPPRLEWASSTGMAGMDELLTSDIHTGTSEGTTREPVQVEPASLDTPQQQRPATRPVVSAITVVGAASSTWEAFLFYLYTGTITFAPLKSSGEARRRQYIKEHKQKEQRRPAPCSCKSIYRLACEWDVPDLKALALSELQSQLSKDNIVSEVFSTFASQHAEVRAAELRVLREHWGKLKDTEEVTGVLRRVVKGELPHAADVMGALW